MTSTSIPSRSLSRWLLGTLLVVSALLSGIARTVEPVSAQPPNDAGSWHISSGSMLDNPARTAPDSAPATAGWLRALNNYRALAHLPPVVEDPQLSRGNWYHARYTIKNNLVQHFQARDNRWYSASGLRAAQSSNIVATGNVGESDEAAIDFWMQAPFHALVMLQPALERVGFGSYREASTGFQMAASLDIYQGIGSLPDQGVYPIRWPAHGTTVPLRAYEGGEVIDPLTSCPGFAAPSGLPILFQLGRGDVTPEVTSHGLRQGSQPVPHCIFDETTYINPNSQYQELGRRILNVHDAVVMVPRAPLTPGASYTVSLTVNGKRHTWSFRVSPNAQPMLTIEPVVVAP